MYESVTKFMYIHRVKCLAHIKNYSGENKVFSNVLANVESHCCSMFGFGIGMMLAGFNICDMVLISKN